MEGVEAIAMKLEMVNWRPIDNVWPQSINDCNDKLKMTVQIDTKVTDTLIEGSQGG